MKISSKNQNQQWHLFNNLPQTQAGEAASQCQLASSHVDKVVNIVLLCNPDLLPPDTHQLLINVRCDLLRLQSIFDRYASGVSGRTSEVLR